MVEAARIGQDVEAKSASTVSEFRAIIEMLMSLPSQARLGWPFTLGGVVQWAVLYQLPWPLAELPNVRRPNLDTSDRRSE